MLIFLHKLSNNWFHEWDSDKFSIVLFIAMLKGSSFCVFESRNKCSFWDGSTALTINSHCSPYVQRRYKYPPVGYTTRPSRVVEYITRPSTHHSSGTSSSSADLRSEVFLGLSPVTIGWMQPPYADRFSLLQCNVMWPLQNMHKITEQTNTGTDGHRKPRETNLCRRAQSTLTITECKTNWRIWQLISQKESDGGRNWVLDLTKGEYRKGRNINVGCERTQPCFFQIQEARLDSIIVVIVKLMKQLILNVNDRNLGKKQLLQEIEIYFSFEKFQWWISQFGHHVSFAQLKKAHRNVTKLYWPVRWS